MIDGILFDKDGTLFDFRASWGAWAKGVLQGLAADYGVDAAQLGAAIGYDYHGGQFSADSVVIAGTTAEVTEALLPHLQGQSAKAIEARLNHAAAHAPMLPAVDLRAVLGGLRARGLRLGVATNDVEASARAHVAAHGLTDLFDFIVGADSGHGAKPGPGMCLAFARQLGIDPTRAVMVGDSLHDLEAGARAGMRTVAVLTGIATAETLGPHATVVLPDIGGISGWLDGLQG